VYENIIKLLKKDIRLRRFTDKEVFTLNTRIEVFIIGLVFTYQMINRNIDVEAVTKAILDDAIEAFINHFIKSH